MKECLNPNCTLYTRLEELPDAYTKCPTCDGPLSSAGAGAGIGGKAAHPSTILSGLSGLSGAALPVYGQPRTYTGYDPTLGNAALPGPEAYGPADETAYPDEYAYGDQDSDGFADAQQVRGSSVARIAFIVAGLLFVMVCGLAVFVLGGTVLSRGKAVSSPQATETALARLMPAINTPITIRPTIQVVDQQPSSANGGAISPPNTPLTAPTAPTAPTATSQPVIVAQPPAATPPPAQAQRGGGVLSGQMSVRFEGGQPVGVTSVYKPADTMHLAIEANYGEGGVKSVLTRWYGPANSLVYEMRKEYTQAGTYFAGFTLKNATPWPTGDYRVDIYPNDSAAPAYSIPFSVIP